jgi:Tfp pilus assembly protein PilO
MPKNFKLDLPRAIVLVLLVLNLVAGWFVYQPFGGSAEEMEAQLSALRNQARERRASLERTKKLTANMDRGRNEGDQFLATYFLSRSTTYSTVVDELSSMAKRAGVRVREHGFVEDPVEGSDELSMLSVNGNYEGTYADLLHFLREVDKAPRLLIIEALSASPQQGTGVLNINMRANAFVREAPWTAVAQNGGGVR